MNLIESKKKGFTLIELLIVIAIISSIITISITSYGVVRKKIALDITANTIESIIIEAREKTRSGYHEIGEDIDEAKSLCFGFNVQKDEYIQRFSAPYDRLREANNKCIKDDAIKVGQDGINEKIVIKDLKLYGDEVDNFEAFFAPPNAVLELDRQISSSDNAFLQIVIGYENNDNKNDQRVIVLNMLTSNTFTDKFNEEYE